MTFELVAAGDTTADPLAKSDTTLCNLNTTNTNKYNKTHRSTSLLRSPIKLILIECNLCVFVVHYATSSVHFTAMGLTTCCQHQL